MTFAMPSHFDPTTRLGQKARKSLNRVGVNGSLILKGEEGNQFAGLSFYGFESN